jgi:hypothetical protein
VHKSGIVILGMHRSGTSLTAELVHRWGAHGGEKAMLEANGWNPRGFWEYRPLVDFNDRLLQAVGSSWKVPPAESEDARLAGMAQESVYRAAAFELLGEMQNGEGPWFWKDPRLTLLLPFWKRIWGDVAYVVPVRDPREIADSLKQRDGLSLSGSLLLWQRYMSAILLDREVASSAFFLSYADLLDNGIAECQRVCKFLDGSAGNQAWAVDERPQIMAQAIAPGLRRNHISVPFSESPLPTSAQKALDSALHGKVKGFSGELTETVRPEPAWREFLISETSQAASQASGNFFQVFWRGDHTGYSESMSRSVILKQEHSRQFLRIAVPQSHADPLKAIRLDLGSQPGFMSIHRITLADASNNGVWAWDGYSGSLQKLPSSQIAVLDTRVSGQKGLVELQGDDPWIEVPLDPSQSAALHDGGAVAIECTYLSPSALFAEVFGWASRVEALSAEQRSTTARLHQLEVRTEALTAEYAASSAGLRRLAARAEALTAENANLSAGLHQLEARAEAVTAESANLSAGLNQMEARAQVFAAEDADLSTRLHQLGVRTETLNAEFAHYSAGLHELEARTQALTSELTRSTASLRQVEARTDALFSEHRGVAIQLQGIESRVETTSSELSAILRSRTWRILTGVGGVFLRFTRRFAKKS